MLTELLLELSDALLGLEIHLNNIQTMQGYNEQEADDIERLEFSGTHRRDLQVYSYNAITKCRQNNIIIDYYLSKVLQDLEDAHKLTDSLLDLAKESQEEAKKEPAGSRPHKKVKGH